MAPRPDPDLIDLIPDEPPPYTGAGVGRGRNAVSIGLAVLLTAAVGIAIDHLFFSQPASEARTEASIPDIKPDAAPIKSAPANPGGMQVPNQNQIVYQSIGQAAAKAQPPAQLAPAAEQPLAPPPPPPGSVPTPSADASPPADNIPAGPATSQSAAMAQAFAPPPAAGTLVMPPPAPPQAAGAPAPPAAAPPPARVASTPSPAASPSSPAFPPSPLTLTPEPPAAPLPKPPPPRPVVAAAPPRTPPEKPEQAKAAPARIASMAPVRAEPEPAAPPEKAAAPPPEKIISRASGDYVIQLAAVSSEAAARQEWSRLQSANHDLLGGLSDDVAKADLGSKGIFWRLRAGPLDQNAARDLCNALTKRNLRCIIAHR